jgi:hypothetical protein
MWRRVGILLTDVSDECIAYPLTLVHRSWISSTLKMEAIRSSETSVNKVPTGRHIPEDDILHSHRRENLKSHIHYLTRSPMSLFFQNCTAFISVVS